MILNVTIKDPIINNQSCYILGLADDDIYYMHYINSFRVVKGGVQIFGAIYPRSACYNVIVTSSWRGSQTIRSCSNDYLSQNNNFPSLKSQSSHIIQCSECGGLCGTPYEELCNCIKRLSSLGYHCIVLFRDVETAFGTCNARHMITNAPAFSNVIEDQNIKWYETAHCILEKYMELKHNKNHVLPSTKDLLSNDVITTTQDSLTHGYSVMVTGQRGLGKSSFCCFLINSFLNLIDRVALLDADLAHPLFGPPGTVSLFIVSKPVVGDQNSFSRHYHFEEVLSVFCGSTSSPEIDPTLYLSAIGQCWCTYQQILSGAFHIMFKCQATSLIDNAILQSCYPYVSSSNALKQMYMHPLLIKSILHSNNNNPFNKKKHSILQWVLSENQSSLSIPLIINSHSWVTGLGWQITLAVGAITWADSIIEITPEADEITKNHITVDVSNTTNTNNNTTEATMVDITDLKKKKKKDQENDNEYKDTSTTSVTSLAVSHPFTHIISCFFGRLPMTLPEKYYITSCCSSSPPSQIKLREKQWLQWMAYFNPAYQYAVHLAFNTYEEFFHRPGSAYGILNCMLADKEAPKLFRLKLADSHGHPRFNFSCVGLATEKFPGDIWDVSATVTASLVALCTGDLDKSSLWVQSASWKFITYCWVHSFDFQSKQMIIYVPSYITTNSLKSANLVVIGHHIEFSPSPEESLLPTIFPHYHAIMEAIVILYQRCIYKTTKGKCIIPKKKLRSKKSIRLMTDEYKNFSIPISALKIFQTLNLTAEIVNVLLQQSHQLYKCITPENILFNKEFIFTSTKMGRRRSGRHLIPRKCQRRNLHY